MRDFRFGFTLSTHNSQRELAETCRTAEAHGFDLAVAVDHLGPGRSSPFQALLAAALATQRMRVGTYVLNLGFWNPSILAREVVTAIRLTGGRLDLGLGIGLIKEEFDEAGIPFLPFGQRLAHLAATIDRLAELIALEDGVAMPPLLIGASGPRALRLAAERADTIGFAGIHHIPGQPPGALRISTAAETAEQVAFVREAAGPRAESLEFNNFVKYVEVTDDRRAVAEYLLTGAAYYQVHSVEHALQAPFLLFGSEQEIAEQIVEQRERYGFTSITVQRPHMHLLGPIIKRVRSMA